MRWLAISATALALVGCNRLNMVEQRKFIGWDRNSFFANGSVMQRPPAGAIAHGLPGAPVPQPARIDLAMVMRGQQKFNIDCSPCHGLAGDGLGMIVQRGFPHPPELYAARLRKAKASQLYHVITDGHGVMYGYADRVASNDRWAIVAYIRALQASAATPVARLEKTDLDSLTAEGKH